MSDASINPATLEFLKKENAKRSKQRKIMMLVAPLLIIGIGLGGYFGISSWRSASKEAAAKEFVAKNMAKGFSPQGFDAMRKAVDSGEFTRDQLWEAGREAREKEMRERMQAYFNTPVKERDKYLDKLIDEMQKRMKEFEAARAKEPTTRPNWGGPPRDGATTRPADGERRDRGQGGPGGRADNQSPADRAMNQEFRAAMMKRMQERGIQMPGRGGWGGGGGGRGPGGGGGRGNGGGR